ncbi:MAG: hypothetical protein A2X25_11865 [Chloroflexi bacterium GWB2_49_20]|nr:MAG: hypothetical protein A2X25_11865 [Chloroflexi bacterium GWB2_49_20]OGN77700.1 MAG: hypothetical protein A2X26_10135 [Chloroflexi bacterium GWC2_49_37]OGN86475.1 MAG: hypothetical protein A2X27_06290 [Chloroflexi bacterium GWD2_49_16]HBG74722.1 hypothetical protein [Anaerolineae bacterium]
MILTTPLLTFDQTCEQVQEIVAARLQAAGLQVMRTFDLQSTQAFVDGCPCQHHGTDVCNCQMVVMLVYGAGEQPLTLILHGYDMHTCLSLAGIGVAGDFIQNILNPETE